jgi:MarR family transcriptional regulator, organic hydroperoxide resistance regulator
MSPGTRPLEPAPAGEAARVRGEAVEDLRQALNHMLGAERRLRGRDHSRSGGLTYAQLRSIAALGRESEVTAGALAKSADLNPASVTAMLDQLEAAGIVRRERSTEDRRVCMVALTQDGWQLLERKLAAWRALWDERLSDFSQAELEAAARVMRRSAEVFDSLGAQHTE